MCGCEWLLIVGNGKWPARVHGHDVVTEIWEERNTRVNTSLT